MAALWPWIVILEEEEIEMWAIIPKDPKRWFESRFWLEYQNLFLSFLKKGVV